MNCYSLQKKKIYIFGIGEFPETIKKILLKKGFDVKAFVVSKCNSLTQDVIDIKTFTELADAETVIIICLQNGNEQVRITNNLYQDGINKIIYLPMVDGPSIEYCHEMRKVYLTIRMGGDIAELKVPYCNPKRCSEDVICNVGDNIVFWCSVNHIKITLDDSNKYLNFIDNKPYFELFEYLLHDRGTIDDYINLNKERHPNIEEFLSDRRRLLETYEYAFTFDRQFFLDSPSNVEWMGDSFYMSDGCHRATYLNVKGFEKVPVICSYGDYEKYISSK